MRKTAGALFMAWVCACSRNPAAESSSSDDTTVGTQTSVATTSSATDSESDSESASATNTDSVTGTTATATGGTSSGTDGGTDGGTTAGDTDGGGWDESDFDNVYHVGPGHPYADPSEVPWENLGPSTLVLIHWREEPYRDKWVINTEATENDPLVVSGVPENGQLPVITGEDAKTRQQLSFWTEQRAVIKVGGSNLPADDLVPSWIHIENLDIRSAKVGNFFTDDGGALQEYADNAASVMIEVGDHVFIRTCVLRDSGNGLFTSWQSSNVVIAGNHIHGNGNVGSIYEHNSYTEARGITFEYNHYGPLREGAGGNNLKDRSAGTVIRYNFIESGNRQLDLVDAGHAEIYGDPSYTTTFVYGNVLVEPDGAGNSQIIHYGGDSGNTAQYRKGMIHLFHNTIVSTRMGNTTLVRLSTADEGADVRNNVVFVTAAGSSLGIVAETGTATLTANWLKSGWVDSHGGGSVVDMGNVEGADPAFLDLAANDFEPALGSMLVGSAQPRHPDTTSHPVTREYVLHQSTVARRSDGDPDIGAFER